MIPLLLIVGFLAGAVVLSLAVEALRPRPEVYGDRDWSLAEERRRTVAAIPGARAETIVDGGHFLPLDEPERLAELIKGVA